MNVSWTVKKAQHQKNYAFELWCWRRLLRVLWTARRSNQSILKEISPGCSLEGLMLKLKPIFWLPHVKIWLTGKESNPSWCWEGLGARGERDDRGWDGWVASQTWWTWVLVNSGSLWWTGRPGMLRFMGSQRVGRDWVTELNWITKDVEHLYLCLSSIHLCFWNICLNTLLLLNWAICLLIINLQSSFYILNTNLLSRICFSNALSQSKPCISFGNNNIWRTIYFYLNEAYLMVHYFVFIV